MGRGLDMSTIPGTQEATPPMPYLLSSDSPRHPASGVTCYSCENNTGRIEAHNRHQNAGAHTELTADPREAGSDRLHAASFRGGNAMQKANSLEKILILGKIESKRSEQQMMKWLDSITDSMKMNLSKLWETVKDREGWHAAQVYMCSPS